MILHDTFVQNKMILHDTRPKNQPSTTTIFAIPTLSNSKYIIIW